MEKFTMKTEYNVNVQPKFTKKDLRTGMFGLTDQKECFVVVENLLVFQAGYSFPILWLNDAMETSTWKIEKIYKNCCSFDVVKAGKGIQIYPAPLPKLTLEEIKEKLGFDFELVDKK